MKDTIFKLILSILSLILLSFIILPLLNIFINAHYDVVITTMLEKEVYDSIFLTFKASLMSTLITIFLGVPLAYILARKDFYGKTVIEGIINLPIIIPHTAAGIALLTFFGKQFIGGKFFDYLNINFVGNFSGIVIAMMFVSLPFLINEVKEGFRQIDKRLEKVARTLGASPFQTFFKVSIPLNLSHIISGAVMMWARGLSEFGAVMILAYHPITTPVLIYERFTSFGLKYSVPVSVVMIILTLIIFVSLRIYQNKRVDIND
ncbi:MAG: ABC transporter permease subunit [Bacillota bacterium]